MILPTSEILTCMSIAENPPGRSRRGGEAAQEAGGAGGPAGVGLAQPRVPRGGARARLARAAAATHLLPQLRVRAHAVDRLHTRAAGQHHAP